MPHRNKKHSIRPFTASDAEAVYSLILSILETEFSDIPAKLFLDDIGNIANAYSAEGDVFLVAEEAGKIIGTIAIKKDDDKVAMVRRFFVHPDYRSRGIGRELLDKAFAFCSENQYTQVEFIGNNRMSRAKEIFVKNGFREDRDVRLPGVEIFKLVHPIRPSA